MDSRKSRFIDFLVDAGALTFGDFVTKSGRKTPYFINTGRFDTGKKIFELGKHYAAHIEQNIGSDYDLLFGPAYKGVPLAVATASALYAQFGREVGYCFDRKEEKSHGDKGKLVGYPISDGSKIILVEDVITAGTTLKEIVPFLRNIADITIVSVVIAVNRCERGSSNIGAVEEIGAELGVKIDPLVTVHDIFKYLSSDNESGLVLDAQMQKRLEQYISDYGV
ncbi:MAG: orotate phosphoribosyltransferase [Bdellovibrionales bacterium]|nr:orotate phosphoribosyltransferase [Bdellovibrionales bacterium]